MRDVLDDLHRWRAAGHRTAVATVTHAWGSSPRPVGSRMLVRDDGETAGSVSGGCVEGAVREEALAVLGDGAPRSLDYGVTNERAWEVGLSCGGRIQILVERVAERDEAGAGVQAEFERSLAAGELVTRTVVLDGPSVGRALLVWPAGQARGDLGSPRLNQRAATHAQKAVRTRQSKRFELAGGDGPVTVFLEVLPPPDRLVVVGAVHNKRTHVGSRVTRRGITKKKGGIGLRITSRTKRKFKSNIQRVRAKSPDGKTVKRVRVCTRCPEGRQGHQGLADSPVRRTTAAATRRGRRSIPEPPSTASGDPGCASGLRRVSPPARRREATRREGRRGGRAGLCPGSGRRRGVVHRSTPLRGPA